MVGNFIYAATYNGIHVIDVSDPAAPVEINCISGSSVYDMLVAGGHVYTVQGRNSLHVWEEVETTTFIEAGHYELPPRAPLVRLWPKPMFMQLPQPSVVDVATVEEYVYLVDGISVGEGFSSRLRVVDMSNPTRPRSIAVYPDAQGSYMRLVVDANYLYFSTRPGWGHAGTVVFEVSDPARPLEISSTLPNGLIAIWGNYAYFAPEDNRLEIWDISDRTFSHRVAQVDLTDIPADVAVSDDHLYVTIPQQGLQVFNIADVTNPQLTGRFAVVNVSREVAVVDQKVYLPTSGLLQVVDFTDPNQLVTTAALPSRIDDLAVVGDYAYTSSYSDGLSVIAVTDPAMPVIASYTAENFHARDIAVSNEYAYVINDGGELWIFDVSNPSVFGEVSRIYYPYFFHDIVITSGYAYLSTGRTQLLILDISDPSNSTEVSLYNSNNNGSFGVITANNGYLFAVYEQWLRVFDISEPESPIEVGVYQLSSKDSHLAVDGEYIYLINGDGMDVFKFILNTVEPLE
jgi:hypothetical protein